MIYYHIIQITILRKYIRNQSKGKYIVIYCTTRSNIFCKHCRCHIPAVRLLLQARADVNISDWSGHSALYWASHCDYIHSSVSKTSKNDCLAMVQVLLNYGANVDQTGCNTCCRFQYSDTSI